jgi:hypothetical protein
LVTHRCTVLQTWRAAQRTYRGDIPVKAPGVHIEDLAVRQQVVHEFRQCAGVGRLQSDLIIPVHMIRLLRSEAHRFNNHTPQKEYKAGSSVLLSETCCIFRV